MVKADKKDVGKRRQLKKIGKEQKEWFYHLWGEGPKL